MPPLGRPRAAMNASSVVAMTSTMASPIATISRLEEATGRLATRRAEPRSTAVARNAGLVTHHAHDRSAALHSAFALRFVNLLRRHGVHRRRARQQAGGTG